jgi:spermidine/putrescine transport system ATP-binding protein
MVRPERVTIGADASTGGALASVQATVTDLVFQGPVVRYELQLPDGNRVIAHIPARRDHLPIPGDTVCASWPPEASVLLPPAPDGALADVVETTS